MTMEYCKHGDLFDVIKRTRKLQSGLSRHYFHQVLDAVEYLHTKAGVAHLDLKIENILIGDDFKLRLCDFGFAEDLSQNLMKNKGTDGYKAPEIYKCISTGGYDGAKSDIFALGVILFIFEFGVPPFLMATKENPLYKFFCNGPNIIKYFFRYHPATKD